MISVDQALAHLFDLVVPTQPELVPLVDAAGRVLTEDIVATRDQPPFSASAMDGYAVSVDAKPGDTFTVVGESAAGHGRLDPVLDTETVRIFTGAPVPANAARIVVQEDVTRSGDRITVTGTPGAQSYIRPKGGDFTTGTRLAAPRRLTPADIALAASMNVPRVTVARRPVVALMSTGDELVMPGEAPGPDQIIVSNTFGLKALLEAAGADVRLLPIARDTRASLVQTFDLAQGADLVVTIGGASVGDHDLVGAVAGELGLDRTFYKIAMRPGKPLMAGRFSTSAMVGLPGNPVSAMVCGHVFLRPMIDAFLGLPRTGLAPLTAQLAVPLRAGSARQHYMRARLEGNQITPADRQDSSLLTVLGAANALLIQPPNAPDLPAGTEVAYIPL
ncbi:molybdopterin molybdotransferase MoeA [Pseudaestuariivita sp.]|uniref:molybdopterin molybdotransferase MoeA n=1 Tax=Pseudaestuariivita sp. TaxID=2211669 RepID=UPI00405A43BA